MNRTNSCFTKIIILLCIVVSSALIYSCSLFLSFPSELQGRWYNRSLTYYTEWFEFSGKTMTYYSSYYGESYDYELKSLDTKAQSFTLDDESVYLYGLSGSTLTLTADTGMVWHLSP